MNQPKPSRAPIAWFDARSVMLFAALTIGGAAVQAQTAATPSGRAAQSGASLTLVGHSSSSGGGSSSATPADKLAQLKQQRRMNRGSAARKNGK
ncbi:hypothetical protein [Diaphorobacter ruginosibacter]|uniref:hypothetical protein n=1 Tax=Diaphorobacter ruginosibacter TaxID=1715720 RepID=UPI00333EBF01